MTRLPALRLLCTSIWIWLSPASADGQVQVEQRAPARNFRALQVNPSGYQQSFSTSLLLGDLLFHTPAVLGRTAESMGMSCNTCHPNGSTNARLFVDGLSDRPGNIDLTSGRFNRTVDDGIPNPINIPSLRGVRYASRFGFDGRGTSLKEFIEGVVHSEFDGIELTPEQLRALVSYVQSQDFLPNRSLTRGGKIAISEPSVLRGEELFNSARSGLEGLSCASCHMPSNYFRDDKVHRRPIAGTASLVSFDDGVKTPTLLNLVETAPYFHDGSAATIEEVVVWYNATYKLGLTATEKQDVVSYLKVVGGTDRTLDDRIPTQLLTEEFAYVNLLLEPQYARDKLVWKWSLKLILEAIHSHPVHPSVKDLVKNIDSELNFLLKRVSFAEKGSLAHLQPRARQLKSYLLMLASRWAAVMSPAREYSASRN